MNKKRISALILGLALMGSSSVFAGPTLAFTKVYYSDASLTVEVGGISVDCNGKVYRWGVITPFRDLTIDEICPGDPN